MEIGQTLNQRYTLITRLGKGAMGIVYRALDTQTGQEVAVKVLAADLTFNNPDDAGLLERFRREGEALRQLKHPNIVGFVDVFEHAEQHVIVMEYIPGGSLHELLKQGPLPLDRTRRLTLELCDALIRAHHLNIIHRDLKPENVLLAADGTPKLTDFGVARLTAEGTRLTGTGTLVGTPFYMSPEAWEGKPLDAQTDIWSLGIMLYEMLSGRVPFSGDTIVAVMNKVLNAPLPDLCTLRPDVPPGLALIVQRMLAREKSERYQSMRELAADLERGEPLATMTNPLWPGAAPARQPKAAPPTVAKKVPTPGAAAGRQRPLWPWLVGGGVIVAALALGGLGLGAGWLLFGKGATVATPSSVPEIVDTPSHIETASVLPLSQARPTCGPGETELFFDNFENGLAGNWRFGDGNNQAAAAWPVLADGTNHILAGTGHAWATRTGAKDIALQVRVRRTTNDATAHLNVRTGDQTRYYVGYYPDAILVRNPPAPPGNVLAHFALGQDTSWHTVRLAAVGHHLEVRLDSQVVAQADDIDGPLAGEIGLENTFGTLWYDDVLVCQLAQAAAEASPAATTGSQLPLKVGVLLPMSGPNAAFGMGASAGVKLALDEWNARGGVLGALISASLADGQCSGSPAVAAAQRLFDQERVHYLIGELCTAASLPVSAIAEQKGVVQISPASSSPKVTLNEDGTTKAYVFRACFIDPFQGNVMANFALGQHLQRAYVIWDESSDYSRGLADNFINAFEKAGGLIGGKEAYTPETQDFTALLGRVTAQSAQVLFIPDMPSRVNLIAQQAKAQKLAAVLMGSDAWESSDLDLAALDGGYYSTSYSILAPQPGAQAWAERYRAQYSREPDAMAALAYDATNLLLTAIQQTGTDDPAKVKDTLAGMSFDGVTGRIAFDAQHNPVKSAVILQIKAGQRVYAGTVEP